MKLNATPRHYMPLPQNQSDDDDNVPTKEEKIDKVIFKNSFNTSEEMSKISRQAGEIEIDPKNLPMSPTRRIIFIMTLVLCVLFVIIFVYCVPCTMSPNVNQLCHVTCKWRRVFHNMSFTSALDIIDNQALESPLIIFGYASSDTGLIAIQESNSEEYWRISLHSLPLLSFCNAIDVNSDGIPDCLVFGNNGLLTAIDAKKGSYLWYLHNHSDLADVTSIDGPIIIHDCDGDEILDIVISYNIQNNENTSHLAVVSGSTGQILSSLIELKDCHGPLTLHFSWEVQNDIKIVLYCTKEGIGNLWLLSSSDICAVALNKTSDLPTRNIFRVPNFVKDIQIYEVTSLSSQLVIVLNGIKFILLECTPQFVLQILWKTHIKADQHMRILADGQFMNGSKQLVVTSSENYNSKILGLNLTDGKELWSIQLDNGTVTSATKLQKFFEEEDGLLLKIISSDALYISNESMRKNPFQEFKSYELARKSFMNNVRFVQESYVFVKCGKVPTIKTINEEDVLTKCDAEGACHPNIFTKNSTVFVKTDKFKASFDMLTVTSTILPTNNAEKIIVKYWKLENILSFSRCIS